MALLAPLKSSLFAVGSEFYEISDEYDSSVTGFSGDYEYFGYLNNVGKWIIQRHQITTGQYRYVNGSSDFSTSFAQAVAGTLTGWGYYNALKNTAA